MIKEDIMDDPERLLANASPDEADDAERAKILSALQEMKGSISKEDDARRNQLDESAIVIDKSVYINNDEDDIASPTLSPGQRMRSSGEDDLEDTMQANPSIEANFETQKISQLATKTLGVKSSSKNLGGK